MRPALFLSCALLAAGCLPKSPAGGPVAVTAADAPPITPVSPAYFATGSSKLASQGDYDRVNQAAAQLKSNPRLYVVLTGYTDADGRPDSNLALSQSRSEYVADLLKKAGCSRMCLHRCHQRLDGPGLAGNYLVAICTAAQSLVEPLHMGGLYHGG